ncbi:DUF1559 family PulG-like putative transporter [Zavarzinella formosa]|uniref:DUF1559 family PulG-like putative transporter n=1 Tax=Zavarzinella formosa TaxID=360055 RepID=UPI0002F4ED8C|nr:DUF1559 domain-containing protein [Zavarzinella formosa]
MNQNSCRNGRTVVSLVVTLTLTAGVIGVTLPAIAKTKTDADRERCRDNFRKIGHAVIDYADHHDGRLPGVYSASATSGGIFPQILTYLGEGKLAKSLESTGKPWHDPANAETIATRLTVAQCPATPEPDRVLSGMRETHAFKAAPTDYTGVPLITEAIRDIFPPGHDRSGTLAYNDTDRRTFADVSDGLSTTSMGIVEIADKPNRWNLNKKTTRENMGNGEGTWVANGFNAPRGYSWDGTKAPGPCAMNCSNSAAVYSFHPDGCNFLMADGSVRFLNKSIDVWLFYAVLTRRGGEMLREADFE